MPLVPILHHLHLHASGGKPGVLQPWNTGSVALVGASYQPTWTGGGNIKISACSVAWDTSKGNCTGTKTTILVNQISGTYDPTTTSGAYPAAAGSQIFLQAQAGNSAPPANVSINIAIAVCSGGQGCSDGTTTRQIQPSETTNG
jgi:hypothetical protein